VSSVRKGNLDEAAVRALLTPGPKARAAPNGLFLVSVEY